MTFVHGLKMKSFLSGARLVVLLCFEMKAFFAMLQILAVNISSDFNQFVDDSIPKHKRFPFI